MKTPKQKFRLYEDLLQAQKQAFLEADITGGEAQQVVELDQARVGRLSRMDALQAQAMSLATGRRRLQHLQKIDAALGRIKEGDFGDCLGCGEPVNPKRLAADPTVTLCISCAQALE